MKHSFLICFILFQMILLPATAQERLIPRTPVDLLENKTERPDYYSAQRRLLIPNGSTFAYLVSPSFHVEYALTYNQQQQKLVLTRAKQQIYAELMKPFRSKGYKTAAKARRHYERDKKKRERKMRKPQKPVTVPVEQFSLPFPREMADSLGRLLTFAIYNSTLLEEKFTILDGTHYTFVKFHGATCHSPRPGTNCGNLVDLMEALCKAVEANDTTSAKALMPKILNIKDTFKALTPSEYERRLGDL